MIKGRLCKPQKTYNVETNSKISSEARMTDVQPNSLRDSFNRWSQSKNEQRAGTTGGASGGSGGYFNSFTDSVNSTVNDVYSKLPTYRQDTEVQEPSWFQLSRWERLTLFGCFLLGSVVCFVICGFLFPILAVKPRKFGLLWSMGSLLFILAFGVLQGPVAYLKHLTGKDRLPFTIFFFLSCGGTIYFAAIVKSTILTILFAVLEVVALLYYAVSYFPFGRQGLSIISSVGLSQARGALSI